MGYAYMIQDEVEKQLKDATKKDKKGNNETERDKD